MTAPARHAAVLDRYRVVEGSCLDCAGDVAGTLGRLPGVTDVRVLTSSGIVVITHDGPLDPAAVDAQAQRIGLRLAPATRLSPPAERIWWRQPKLIALAVAAIFLAAGLIAEKGLGADAFAIVLYLAGVLVGGIFPVRSALQAMRSRRLTISTLLVVATVGAVALGVFEEAALLVVVFSLGELLEDYTSDKARGSIRALMALTPPVARRRDTDGALADVPVEELLPGDLVVVRPGERLPTDGEVAAGRSAVDQSPVTGESIPVEVTVGSQVFGGTVNGNGTLDVRVTKEYADTTLARIIRQVEEAQAHAGTAQRFADRFGAVYTPAIFVLAAVIAIVGPLASGDARTWLYRSLVVLTVSCSCALVISVPVSVVAAISRAARDGILIKGGAYLERLARLGAVAFDKTGTLTRGRPELTDIVMAADAPEPTLAWAAAIEEASEHPLARALVEGARGRGLRWSTASDAQAQPGVGVAGRVEGHDVFVGRPTNTLPASLAGDVGRLEAAGKTVVVVSVDGRAAAVIAVADELRPEARASVAALRRHDVEHVVMLTGDNDRTAAAIAAQAGIDQWRSGLLPEDKTTAVNELTASYG